MIMIVKRIRSHAGYGDRRLRIAILHDHNRIGFRPGDVLPVR